MAKKPEINKKYKGNLEEVKGLVSDGVLPSDNLCISEYRLIYSGDNNSVYSHLMVVLDHFHDDSVCPMTMYIYSEWDFIKEYIDSWYESSSGTIYVTFSNPAFFLRTDGSTKFNVGKKEPLHHHIKKLLIRDNIDVRCPNPEKRKR